MSEPESLSESELAIRRAKRVALWFLAAAVIVLIITTLLIVNHIPKES